MSKPSAFDFDITPITGDGTCFYHMLSVALFGHMDGHAIRADVHKRWNGMTDIYNHVKSESAFHRYLVNFATLNLGESRDRVWKMLDTNKPELFRRIGDFVFGGNTYAEEFAINITALLYRIEVNVLVVTEQTSGKLMISDTRKFPYDHTTELTYANFKNWTVTRSVATALFNQSFYVNSTTSPNSRFPNHFTNIYHYTKTYADVLTNDKTTRVTTKPPGGWDMLLDGARSSLIEWISRRYVSVLFII